MQRRMLFPAPLLAWPRVSLAQRRAPIVGFLGLGSETTDMLSVVSFRTGMRRQGQVEGQGWLLDRRHADGDFGRAQAMITELAALPVAVFVVPGAAAARAVQRATPLPIVAIGLPPAPSDPELFQSLARPGGSVTGFASFGEEMSAKRLEFLREMIPGLAAIGVMHNGIDPNSHGWGQLTGDAIAAQGMRAIPLPLRSRDGDEVSTLLRRLRAEGGGAVIVVRDFLTSTLMDGIIAQAKAFGLAVVGEQARFARSGALLTYGASIPDLFRRAAGYVTRILRGERPGDLPVQLPTEIEFVINLRSARALGLSVPSAILARADEVIE